LGRIGHDWNRRRCFARGGRWRAARWPIRLLAVFAVLGSLLAFTQTAMAASASDDFNRANGALGASWTKISDGALAISGQAVAGTAAANYSGDLWTASTFGGTWTQLGSIYSSGPLAAGSKLQIRAVGSTISLMQNGITRISVTDTTLTSGALGIYAYGKGRADNWTGGDVSTYSVGGTVSGLSGSVVLQDNGGDNLTVSANGSFTFATKLASGASYNVTVQTNPAGQTCTTANGTGTIASANITSITVPCAANTAGSGSDVFNRANGSLGPNWTDASDGGLTITGQQVAGTAGNSYSGDIRTAETYPADQFSQITLTSTQLTGGQWIGAAVRMQNGGQNQYLGIYFWNNGSPDLMLFKRNASKRNASN
jgi:hypothetical protein